jgi:hypothetical protein
LLIVENIGCSLNRRGLERAHRGRLLAQDNRAGNADCLKSTRDPPAHFITPGRAPALDAMLTDHYDVHGKTSDNYREFQSPLI